MPPTEEERKLLKILDEPEIVLETPEDPEMGEEISERVAAAFPELSEQERRVMEKVITAKMPSPEEIERAERMTLHNAEVARSRREKLAARRERQAAGIKPVRRKKSSRRRGRR